MDDRVSLCGSLAESGYPELLKKLHDERCTGSLMLQYDGTEKTVHLRDGALIFARSNNPNERLGEFLLRREVISLRQYIESSARIAPGRRQGAILCEMGAISPDDLFTYVKEQVNEIICSLFEWRAGRFEVLRDDSGSEEPIVLSIPIEDVILQGVRRVTDWARIWKGLGAEVRVAFKPTETANSLGYHASLTQNEAQVLSLVSGRFEVGRILELSYAADFETCRILWALLLVGAIEPCSEADREASAVGEDYELAELVEEYAEVFKRVHGFVADRLGDLVDHFMDRVVDETSGRHEALHDVHLRNQGRVEYEQVFANLRLIPGEDRQAVATAALDDLLSRLLDHTRKELGPEEESLLLRELSEMNPQQLAVRTRLRSRGTAAADAGGPA